MREAVNLHVLKICQTVWDFRSLFGGTYWGIHGRETEIYEFGLRRVGIGSPSESSVHGGIVAIIFIILW